MARCRCPISTSNPMHGAALAESIIILVARYGPEFVERIYTLAAKKDVTPADWIALFAMAQKPIASVSDMPRN